MCVILPWADAEGGNTEGRIQINDSRPHLYRDPVLRIVVVGVVVGVVVVGRSRGHCHTSYIIPSG